MRHNLYKAIFLSIVSIFTVTKLIAQKEYIVTVDPSNAAITKIDSIQNVRYIQSFAEFNQSTKEFTFIGTYQPGQSPSYLYTLDAVSGDVITNPLLSSINNFISIQYSRSTGVLYGIIFENGTYYLSTIDKTSGTYTIIHDIPGMDGVGSFTIDEANQRLYIKAVDNNPNFAIWTIDLVTGNIIYHASTQNLSNLHYDNVSHKLYALTFRSGPTPGSNILSISTVDPVTGIVTNIADLNTVAGIIGGDHGTFNEAAHLYLFTGVENSSPGIKYLYSIDAITGNINSRVAVPSSGTIDHDNLVCFRYDNESGKLYALLWEANTVLPVTLNKFSAISRKKTVICKWQTFQEINSSRFIIERSSNLYTYMAIGQIAAANNSSTILNYDFTDYDPYSLNSEYIYYRLKMEDRDGNYRYSNVIRIKLNYEPSVNIFPNPVNNRLTFDLISSNNNNVTVSIVDLPGRILYNQKSAVKKGNNSFSINTSNLDPGIYTLLINDGNYYTEKFIKN